MNNTVRRWSHFGMNMAVDIEGKYVLASDAARLEQQVEQLQERLAAISGNNQTTLAYARQMLMLDPDCDADTFFNCIKNLLDGYCENTLNKHRAEQAEARVKELEAVITAKDAANSLSNHRMVVRMNIAQLEEMLGRKDVYVSINPDGSCDITDHVVSLQARLTRLEAAARYTVRKMHDSTIVYDMDKCCKRLEHALAEPQEEE